MKSFSDIVNQEVENLDKKVTSAGIIITDGNVILGCLVDRSGRHKQFYDLPKGKIDPGESAQKAAVRETWEEANIKINPKKLIDLGRFKYLKKSKYWPAKDIHLFMYKVDTANLPSLSLMKCNSFYHDKDGSLKPETIGFKYIGIKNIKQYMSKNMIKVLGKVL